VAVLDIDIKPIPVAVHDDLIVIVRWATGGLRTLPRPGSGTRALVDVDLGLIARGVDLNVSFTVPARRARGWRWSWSPCSFDA
jgi:hypothetical protein